MWGVLWTFGSILDDDWLTDDGNLEKMAECGFRIYYTEEIGYFGYLCIKQEV